MDRDHTDQELVDSVYKGSWKDYEADLARGRKETISWDDIAAYGNVLPQYSEEAADLIRQYLGYEVHHSISILHEPFIRAAIQKYNSGQLTDIEFNEEVIEHVKNIRNEDMVKGDFLNEDTPYTRIDYIIKDLHFAECVRNRLCWFMSYEPKTEYSGPAELLLRRVLATEPFDLNWPLQQIDYKAITITRYREAYFELGKEVADRSPLIGKAE